MPRSDEDSIVGAIVGILAGLVGVAILQALFAKKKCPYCMRDIPQNAAVCPFCSARLNW